MKLRLGIFYYLIIVGFLSTNAQIVINEVSSANESIIADFEGDYEDWIELYNPGPNAINLQGYYLETFEKSQKRWYFPNTLLKSDSCFLVFCSKKDRTAVIDHYELPVTPWTNWRYMVGNAEPDTNWTFPGFNDALWLQGNAPIGYGDGDDTSIISPTPATSLYMRETINLLQPENILVGFILIDYDDAFVAYINGVEVARNNIWTPGKPPFDASASEEHEAKVYSCPNQADPLSCAEFFYIDEETVSDLLVPGENVFSVQIHNFNLGMDDMTGYPLLLFGIQGPTTTFFSFPSSDNLHTNFNLSSEGQRISLKDTNGIVVDEYIIGELHKNHSRGRYPDGSDNWCLMEFPSPCAPNTGPCISNYMEAPTINKTAGFYNSAQTITINANPPGELIFYTTDGSVPSPSSNYYSGPFTISQTTAVRARQFPSVIGLLPSRSVTKTFFINDKPTLPVVSLNVDPYLLFDETTGIYMIGPNTDTIAEDFPYWGSANYYQDWMRPAHVEYFDKNGIQELGQNCAIKIHGNFSRGWPQKSFRFFANDRYGDSWFNFQPFTKKPGIKRLKSFNVRNGGVDYNTTHFRDALMQMAARNTHIDIMDNQPVVMYINGNYWGVYGLRERQDDNYLQENYDINGDFVDLLRFNGDVMNGSDEGFVEMTEFIAAEDMQIIDNYQIAESLLDIENFCDYIITETYFVNGDWISPEGGTNNIKFWRNTAPISKWRYILWDTDLGLNLLPPWQPGEDYQFDYLAQLFKSNYTDPHSIMLQNLMENKVFKNYFINRFADLVNTEYSSNTFSSVAQSVYDEYQPEMQRHFAKWGAPPKLIWNTFTLGRSSTKAEWLQEFNNLMTFIIQRPFYARNNMESLFSLNGQVDITLDVVPKGAGTIKISTITPDSYPWSGVYFDGVPVKITASENAGYNFLYWKSNLLIPIADSNNSFTLNINIDDQFTAYFEAIDYDIIANPNPFNSDVKINYNLPKVSQVSIKLFDRMGKLIHVLSDYTSFKDAGKNEIILNPEQYNLSAGVYILEFEVGIFRKSIKLVHLKAD